MEPDTEATVYDSSLRFSERTFIRMMTRIMQIIFANDLPTAGKISSLESSLENRGLEEKERRGEKLGTIGLTSIFSGTSRY